MNNNTTIQFTRGVLLFEQMKNYAVPVLDFPFEDAFDILMEMRVRLDEDQGTSGNVQLPTQSLNDFLYFFVPTLAHPFVKNQLEQGKKLAKSDKWLAPMPALGLPRLLTEPQVDPLPAALLKQIVVFWIEEAIEKNMNPWYFSKEELQEERVLKAITESKTAVDKALVEWKFENLQDLWLQRTERVIGYRALQSLLTIQFIRNAKTNLIQIDNESIDWRLSQEGTHLIPVSQVIQHEDGGYYAYTIEIEVRDMPGRNNALVYFLPRLRRYMGQKVTWRGDDDVRVMVEFPAPLSRKLPQQQISIQVPLRIMSSRPVYRSDLIPMLQRVTGKKINNILPDVGALLADPAKYFKADKEWGNATYQIIYNTGMKPEHQMDPGLPDKHLQTIHFAFANNLEEWLLPENPFEIAEELTLSNAIIFERDWLSLFSIRMLRDNSKVWGNRKPAKKRLPWLSHIQERFRIALNNKALVIILIADNPQALDAMEFDARSILAVLSMEEPLPSGFEIIRLFTPPEVAAKIDNPKSWKDDSKTIRKYIGSAIQVDKTKTYVAIIQRPKRPKKSDEIKVDDAKKSALRLAFGSSKIRTQMLRRFPDEPDKGLHVRQAQEGIPLFIEDRSRLMNATSDALITGTGMTYDAPAEIYTELLGFEQSLAQSIVVEYWIRARSNKPKIDYVAIARQYANTGYIEVIFPDSKTGEPLAPMSVHDGFLYLQELFAHSTEKQAENKRIYTPYADNPDNRVPAFFQSQLYKREKPTLIVPHIGDWNSRETKWFSDDSYSFNSIRIGTETYSSSDLPNIRVVKMLTDEKFNMRYWLHNPQAHHENALLVIRDNVVQIPTIYSIDLSHNQDTDHEDIAEDYKRGRVIEFAATMMQPEDLGCEYAWCTIPHLARIHPGWSKGKSVQPYPRHLVIKMVEDAKWTMGQ